jgi:hypothetical protein
MYNFTFIYKQSIFFCNWHFFKCYEIWFSFNRFRKNDPVWEKFCKIPNEKILVQQVNYYDNPEDLSISNISKVSSGNFTFDFTPPTGMDNQWFGIALHFDDTNQGIEFGTSINNSGWGAEFYVTNTTVISFDYGGLTEIVNTTPKPVTVTLDLKAEPQGTTLYKSHINVTGDPNLNDSISELTSLGNGLYSFEYTPTNNIFTTTFTIAAFQDTAGTTYQGSSSIDVNIIFYDMTLEEDVTGQTGSYIGSIDTPIRLHLNIIPGTADISVDNFTATNSTDGVFSSYSILLGSKLRILRTDTIMT